MSSKRAPKRTRRPVVSGSQLVLEPLGLPVPPGSLKVSDRSSQVVPEPPLSGSEPQASSGGTAPLSRCVPLLTSSSRRPVRVSQSGPERVLADADVRALPARLWGSLPLAASLCCRSEFTPLALIVTNHRGVWQALRRRGLVVFGTSEWIELVSSYENDRANPVSFAEWCEYKRRSPTWRVTRRDAIGVIASVEGPRTDTTLGRVLDAWGVSVSRVLYGAEVPT